MPTSIHTCTLVYMYIGGEWVNKLIYFSHVSIITFTK